MMTKSLSLIEASPHTEECTIHVYTEECLHGKVYALKRVNTVECMHGEVYIRRSNTYGGE